MTKGEFVSNWVGMVWCVARAMGRTYKLSEEDVEDVVQSVLLKLSKLKPTQRKMPDVWIRVCINNSARDALGQILRSTKNVFSYDQPIGSQDGEEATYADVFEDPSQHPDTDAQRKVMVEKFLSVLSEQEQQIIRWHFGFDGQDALPAAEIARRLNSNVRHVRLRIAEAIQKTRDIITPPDITQTSLIDYLEEIEVTV